MSEKRTPLWKLIPDLNNLTLDQAKERLYRFGIKSPNIRTRLSQAGGASVSVSDNTIHVDTGLYQSLFGNKIRKNAGMIDPHLKTQTGLKPEQQQVVVSTTRPDTPISSTHIRRPKTGHDYHKRFPWDHASHRLPDDITQAIIDPEVVVRADRVLPRRK